MNTRLKNKRLRIGRLLFLLLLTPVAPMAFTACDTAYPEITITMESDYKQIFQTINDVNKSLTEKLSLIESAFSDGFADSKVQQEMIQEALESLSGTMDEKLAAIETAVKSQTASLETKLALIEAAVKNGFATETEKQQLIKEAIDSLEGSTEEKLVTIQEAITSQTTSLAGKFDLIQGALDTGLGDAKTALDEIKDAINSLKTSVDGDADLIKKIDEIVSELGTINTTLNDDVSEALTDILSAIAGQNDYSEILAAIQKAIKKLLELSNSSSGGDDSGGTAGGGSGSEDLYNGHAYVDMGNGLKWATMNVGATKPEDSGSFFAWGETTVKSAYTARYLGETIRPVAV